ncbi:MAG: membrane dipeptidase, partial [Acetanaerobacterium sp.]
MNYFDLHCDTLSEMLKSSTPLLDGPTAVSLKKGEQLKSWCQCFAIWTHDSAKGEAAYANYKKQLALLNEQAILNSDRMTLCKSRSDMEQAVAEGKCAAILTVENGSVIVGDLSKIAELKKDGVKIFSFTWNGKNELGSGIGSNNSLSMVGRSAVVELNRA